MKKQSILDSLKKIYTKMTGKKVVQKKCINDLVDDIAEAYTPNSGGGDSGKTYYQHFVSLYVYNSADDYEDVLSFNFISSDPTEITTQAQVTNVVNTYKTETPENYGYVGLKATLFQNGSTAATNITLSYISEDYLNYFIESVSGVSAIRFFGDAGSGIEESVITDTVITL